MTTSDERYAASDIAGVRVRALESLRWRIRLHNDCTLVTAAIVDAVARVVALDESADVDVRALVRDILDALPKHHAQRPALERVFRLPTLSVMRSAESTSDIPTIADVEAQLRAHAHAHAHWQARSRSEGAVTGADSSSTDDSVVQEVLEHSDVLRGCVEACEHVCDALLTHTHAHSSAADREPSIADQSRTMHTHALATASAVIADVPGQLWVSTLSPVRACVCTITRTLMSTAMRMLWVAAAVAARGMDETEKAHVAARDVCIGADAGVSGHMSVLVRLLSAPARAMLASMRSYCRGVTCSTTHVRACSTLAGMIGQHAILSRLAVVDVNSCCFVLASCMDVIETSGSCVIGWQLLVNAASAVLDPYASHGAATLTDVTAVLNDLHTTPPGLLSAVRFVAARLAQTSFDLRRRQGTLLSIDRSGALDLPVAMQHLVVQARQRDNLTRVLQDLPETDTGLTTSESMTALLVERILHDAATDAHDCHGSVVDALCRDFVELARVCAGLRVATRFRKVLADAAVMTEVALSELATDLYKLGLDAGCAVLQAVSTAPAAVTTWLQALVCDDARLRMGVLLTCLHCVDVSWQLGALQCIRLRLARGEAVGDEVLAFVLSSGLASEHSAVRSAGAAAIMEARALGWRSPSPAFALLTVATDGALESPHQRVLTREFVATATSHVATLTQQQLPPYCSDLWLHGVPVHSLAQADARPCVRHPVPASREASACDVAVPEAFSALASHGSDEELEHALLLVTSSVRSCMLIEEDTARNIVAIAAPLLMCDKVEIRGASLLLLHAVIRWEHGRNALIASSAFDGIIDLAGSDELEWFQTGRSTSLRRAYLCCSQLVALRILARTLFAEPDAGGPLRVARVVASTFPWLRSDVVCGGEAGDVLLLEEPGACRGADAFQSCISYATVSLPLHGVETCSHSVPVDLPASFGEDPHYALSRPEDRLHASLLLQGSLTSGYAHKLGEQVGVWVKAAESIDADMMLASGWIDWLARQRWQSAAAASDCIVRVYDAALRTSTSHPSTPWLLRPLREKCACLLWIARTVGRTVCVSLTPQPADGPWSSLLHASFASDNMALAKFSAHSSPHVAAAAALQQWVARVRPFDAAGVDDSARPVAITHSLAEDLSMLIDYSVRDDVRALAFGRLVASLSTTIGLDARAEGDACVGALTHAARVVTLRLAAAALPLPPTLLVDCGHLLATSLAWGPYSVHRIDALVHVLRSACESRDVDPTAVADIVASLLSDISALWAAQDSFSDAMIIAACDAIAPMLPAVAAAGATAGTRLQGINIAPMVDWLASRVHQQVSSAIVVLAHLLPCCDNAVHMSSASALCALAYPRSPSDTFPLVQALCSVRVRPEGSAWMHAVLASAMSSVSAIASLDATRMTAAACGALSDTSRADGCIAALDAVCRIDPVMRQRAFSDVIVEHGIATIRVCLSCCASRRVHSLHASARKMCMQLLQLLHSLLVAETDIDMHQAVCSQLVRVPGFLSALQDCGTVPGDGDGDVLVRVLMVLACLGASPSIDVFWLHQEGLLSVAVDALVHRTDSVRAAAVRCLYAIAAVSVRCRRRISRMVVSVHKHAMAHLAGESQASNATRVASEAILAWVA